MHWFLCWLVYLWIHQALVAKEWEREYWGLLCKQRGIPRRCQVDGRDLKHSSNKPGIYRGLPGETWVSINSTPKPQEWMRNRRHTCQDSFTCNWHNLSWNHCSGILNWTSLVPQRFKTMGAWLLSLLMGKKKSQDLQKVFSEIFHPLPIASQCKRKGEFKGTDYRTRFSWKQMV